MATGKITQIIGAVIDVQFPRESVPNVYEALKLAEAGLTLEVQQHRERAPIERRVLPIV